MTASDIDRGATITPRAAYDPRIVHAHSRAVADLQRAQRGPAQVRVERPRPQAIAVPTEQPQAAVRARRRRTNWSSWIVVAVGSSALVAAGYLGALVQLSAFQPQRHGAIPEAAASVPPPKPDPIAAPTTARVAAATVVIHGPARVGAPARRSKAHRVDVKAAALATAELERELYDRPAPVQTIWSLPEQPSRESVQQALLAMRPRLAACAAGRHGMVDARVSIAGSGRVTRALIQGDFAGTREGSCMALALRAATVQSFAGPIFQVQFPFAL